MEELIKKAKEAGIIFTNMKEKKYMITTPYNILYLFYDDGWTDVDMAKEINQKLEMLQNRTWTKYI